MNNWNPLAPELLSWSRCQCFYVDRIFNTELVVHSSSVIYVQPKRQSENNQYNIDFMLTEKYEAKESDSWRLKQHPKTR